MRKIFSLTCLVIIVLLGRSAIAQQINKAEYFFDTDPGLGKGNPIAVTAADSVDITGTAITTGLNPGFHRLVIRVKNTAGKWSLYDARNFYINLPVNNTNPSITAAESFFDIDPGLGNGAPITVSTPGDSIDVSSSVITTGLAPGFHRLCVRVKNASGLWSLYDARNFYINAPPPSNNVTITAAECFFDNDPGLGKGKAVAVPTPGDSIDLNPSISTAGLKNGFHHFSVRVKNTLGIWSLYDTRVFFLDTVLGGSNSFQDTIVAGESYFDTDPGLGKATPISPTFSPAIDSVDLNNSIVASGLGQGHHTMFIRMVDTKGNWSNTAAATFLICNNAPVAKFGESNKGLVVTFADSSLNPITYHWDFGDGDTSDVANPSHTYSGYNSYTVTLTITDSCGSANISHSVNVVNNTGISTVSASANGASVYPNPSEGNFILGYHLTMPDALFQVKDILGRDVYSATIKGLSGTQYINASGLSSGLFYWQIVAGSQVLSNGKLVITK